MRMARECIAASSGSLIFAERTVIRMKTAWRFSGGVDRSLRERAQETDKGSWPVLRCYRRLEHGEDRHEVDHT